MKLLTERMSPKKFLACQWWLISHPDPTTQYFLNICCSTSSVHWKSVSPISSSWNTSMWNSTTTSFFLVFFFFFWMERDHTKGHTTIWTCSNNHGQFPSFSTWRSDTKTLSTNALRIKSTWGRKRDEVLAALVLSFTEPRWMFWTRAPLSCSCGCERPIVVLPWITATWRRNDAGPLQNQGIVTYKVLQVTCVTEAFRMTL